MSITGVSLHSYRYAWAERAKCVGMQERFAQQALGHSSKALARAYSKKAKVVVPSLEDFERKIIPMPKGSRRAGDDEEDPLTLAQAGHAG